MVFSTHDITTAFTTVHHILNWTNTIQTVKPYLSQICFTRLYLSPKGSLDFPNKIYEFLTGNKHATCPVHFFSL